MTEKPKMRLENWYRFGNVVIGNVYGNPRFDEGYEVKTSKIKHIKGDILTTRNSTYLLVGKAIDAEPT